jgi:hypothetical protein
LDTLGWIAIRATATGAIDSSMDPPFMSRKN